MYCAGRVFRLSDGFCEDLIRGLDPGERRGEVVPGAGELVDGAGEVHDAAEAAAAHRLTGEDSEPGLDLSSSMTRWWA